MKRISIGEILPGMVLASDVANRNGAMIVSTGVVLGDKHVRAFKMWGITSITIESDDEGAAPEDAQTVLRELDEAGRTRLKDLFRFNAEHANHPLIQTLIRRAYTRVAENAAAPSSGIAPSPEPPQREYVDEDYKPVLRLLVERVGNVASPPETYARLMGIVEHPHASASDIAEVISQDPALTSNLLRIANSSFYAFPGRIETVSQAVTLVGTTQLCDLALSTSVTKLFNRVPPELADPSSYWEHSVSCGVLARQLALLRREPNAERLFVAGLLHDIGRAVLFLQCGRHMANALLDAQKRRMPLYEAERNRLGFSHTDLGRALLETWNLPGALCEILARHHRPETSTKFPAETAIIHIADLIANAMQLGSSGERRVPPLSTKAWDILEISPDVLPGLIEDAQHQVTDMVAILRQE